MLQLSRPNLGNDFVYLSFPMFNVIFIRILAFLACLSMACQAPLPEEKKLAPISPEQAEALAALDVLQTSSDEANHLFSTFSGAQEFCTSPDTVLQLSAEDFFVHLKSFADLHYSSIDTEKRLELCQKAARIQDHYTLWICLDQLELDLPMENKLHAGTWVFPQLLGRRDLVWVW